MTAGDTYNSKIPHGLIVLYNATTHMDHLGQVHALRWFPVKASFLSPLLYPRVLGHPAGFQGEND